MDLGKEGGNMVGREGRKTGKEGVNEGGKERGSKARNNK